MQITSHFTANGLVLEEFPFNSELAMAGFLADNPSILSLDDDFFNTPEFKGSEIKMGDGRLDLLFRYGEESKAIIECKKNTIDECNLPQLKTYLNDRRVLDPNPQTKWLGILVGTRITEKFRRKIVDGEIACDNVIIGALVIRRFKASNQIFTLTESFINIEKATKDFTKYDFMLKKNLSKNRLVLETVCSKESRCYFQHIIKSFSKKHSR
jgi:hypothetical protein